MLPFKVTKKYQRGAEQIVAKFQEASEARNFIDMNLAADANLRVDVTYRLYDFDDLMDEYSQGQASGSSSSSQGQGSGQSNAQSFSPTPFSMTARPGGMPVSSFKDVPEKKDKDE